MVKEYGIRISLDGKGWSTNNAHVERFFRTLKHEYIYLYPTDDGLTLYKDIEQLMNRCNNRRNHQGIDRRKPIEM